MTRRNDWERRFGRRRAAELGNNSLRIARIGDWEVRRSYRQWSAA